MTTRDDHGSLRLKEQHDRSALYCLKSVISGCRAQQYMYIYIYIYPYHAFLKKNVFQRQGYTFG